MTPDAFFIEQIKILSNALCNNCFVMGDFNLDARMSNRPDYFSYGEFGDIYECRNKS